MALVGAGRALVAGARARRRRPRAAGRSAWEGSSRTAGRRACCRASSAPSRSMRTGRELRRMSMRWNGSRAWPTSGSSSSSQRVEAREVEDHVAGQVGVGRREGHALARGAAGAQRQASPSVECTANGDPGCRTGGACAEPSAAGAGTSSPRTSSIGTAKDGTTRRGSQTSSGAAAVDHLVVADERADAPLDGLVAQLVEPLEHRVAHADRHRVSLAGAAPRPGSGPTAARSVSRSPVRLWLPGTVTTLRASRLPAACRTGRRRPAPRASGRRPRRARAGASSPGGPEDGPGRRGTARRRRRSAPRCGRPPGAPDGAPAGQERQAGRGRRRRPQRRLLERDRDPAPRRAAAAGRAGASAAAPARGKPRGPCVDERAHADPGGPSSGPACRSASRRPTGDGPRARPSHAPRAASGRRVGGDAAATRPVPRRAASTSGRAHVRARRCRGRAASATRWSRYRRIGSGRCQRS